MSNRKIDTGVTLKLAAFMGLATALLFAAGISISYSGLASYTRDTCGKDQAAIAKLVASSVDDSIKENIESMKMRSLKEPTNAALAGSIEVTSGNIEFDEKTGSWGMPLTIGDYNTSLNIENISTSLDNFKLGRTGHAAIVDERAYLVYAPGAKPFSNKFCSYSGLQKALDTKKDWVLMDEVYGYQGNVFASSYPVKNDTLSKSNVKWWVFVVRPASDISTALDNAMLKMVYIAILFVIIAMLAGVILSKMSSAPIAKLRQELELSSASRDKAEERLKNFSACFASALIQLHGVISDIRQGLKPMTESAPGQGSEKRKEVLHAENANINMLVKEIGDLSDIAKIESGKLDLNVLPVDIKEVIKSSIFIFEPKIRGKGLDMRLNIPKGTADVHADVGRIKQVLSNLISNAIKLTDKGNIDISVKELPDEIEFSISDTSAGIKKENIDNTFGMTQQGMDAGLYLSKAIIEMHKGRIWVENVPGKGSKFSFRLPKHKSEKTG